MNIRNRSPILMTIYSTKKNNICAIALDENQLKQEIKKILKIDKLKIVH